MRIGWVLCTALLAWGECALAQEAELRAALDLPTAEARRKMAAPLAGLSPDALAQAIANVRPDGTATEGITHHRVVLEVEGKSETTELSVYLPASYTPEAPAPLLLSLHGSGGDGRHEHARWSDVAERLGMIVLSPTEAGPNEGYAFTLRERANTLQALRWARRRYRVDPARIHVTGISRGGHLAWDLALRHPDLFASVSPMIGGPRLDARGGQNNLRFVENVAHLSIRDLQGEGDDPRMLFNLRLAFERLEQLGAKDAKLLTFAGLGHSFEMGAVDWHAFLGECRRDARPARVVRLCTLPTEGRAYWAEVLKVERSVKENFSPRVAAEMWNALDDGGRRRWLAQATEENTARLEVVMEEKGLFRVSSRGVSKFRLLLEPDMFAKGESVRIVWNGKARTKQPKVQSRILLEDFLDRLDTGFLPVAEVVLP